MSPGATAAVPPPMMWAQRNDVIYLTINVECSQPELKFTEDTFYFKGVGVPEKVLYEVTLNFLNKINPDTIKNKNNSRNIEFILTKAESGPYWSNLTTDKKKPHFLRADFNKWRDEGSDDENEDSSANMMDLVSEMGGLCKDGSKKPSFDELDDESDSDDEDLPDLERS